LKQTRWSIALHALARETVHLSQDLVNDGFESFLRSKYYPHPQGKGPHEQRPETVPRAFRRHRVLKTLLSSAQIIHTQSL